MRGTIVRPNRARLLMELYFRAYWRYYLITVIWVLCSILLLPQYPA